MGISKVPSGQNISESPDVTITSIAEGQTLAWDAATSKWLNGLQHTIVTPTISSPADGTIFTSGLTQTFSSSSYTITPTNTLLTHVSSDWQMASDAGFATIIASTSTDTSNLTSWTPTIPSGAPLVYVRVRYANQTSEKSAYSATKSYSVYQTAVYNTSGNFVTPATTNTVDAWVVGSGGGGSQSRQGGSGGGVTATSGVAVTPGTTYAVTVGTGGNGTNTSDTSAGGSSSFRTVTAAGATVNASGNGFARNNANAAYGPYGSNGYTYGGGGGAGAVGGAPSGSTQGAGGAGVNVTFDSVRRGGGGGGGGTAGGYNANFIGGTSAVDGGGAGKSGRYTGGNAGTAATGGGGSAGLDSTGGAGGNGVVLLRYTV